MMDQFLDQPALRQIGYSPDGPAVNLAAVLAGSRPSDLRGDFVLVAEGIDRNGHSLVVLVSTVAGAVPYFITRPGLPFHHGSDLIAVARAAGLPWKWNRDALDQLLGFDHLLGEATLHPDILRLPAASLLVVRGGKRTLETESYWADWGRGEASPTALEKGADLLTSLVQEIPQDQPWLLSLSAGCDSRMLLAVCLHLKRPCELTCFGAEEGHDVRTARQIARQCGMPLRHLALDTQAFDRSGTTFARITNGEKSAAHWHTAVYAEQLQGPERRRHLVGSNGEIARSFYLPWGFVGLLASVCPGEWWRPRLAWANHPARRVPHPYQSIAPPGSPGWSAADFWRHLPQDYYRGRSSAEALDVFYTTERVRHLIAGGLSLYRQHDDPVSPFLDARFITWSGTLPRRAKLAEAFPRSVIGALAPNLLQFPTRFGGCALARQQLLRGPGRIRPVDALTMALPEEAESLQKWQREGLRVLGIEPQGHNPPRWGLPISLGAFAQEIARVWNTAT